MRKVAFANLARRLASTLGRRVGVGVTFSGRTASTDGSSIKLPSIAEGVELNDDEYRLFMGYLDHEIMHVRFSSFDALKKRVEKYRSLGDTESLSEHSVLKYLSGMVEDVRGELRYIQEYPGSKEGLDYVCAHVDGQYREILMESGEEEGKLNKNKVLQMIGEALFRYRGCSYVRKECLLDFPELKGLVSIIRDFPKCSSTEDSLDFAEVLFAEINRLYPDDSSSSFCDKMKDTLENLSSQYGDPNSSELFPSSAGSGGSSDSKDPSEPSDSKDPSEPSDSKDPSEPSDSKDPSEPSDSKDPSSLTQEDGGKSLPPEVRSSSDRPVRSPEYSDSVDFSEGYQEVGGSKSSPSYVDIRSKFLEDFINAKNEDLRSLSTKLTSSGSRKLPKSDSCILPPASPSLDQVFVYPKENLPAYEAIRNRFSSSVLILKKGLQRYLQSRKKVARQRGEEEGLLDGDALWSLSTDNTRVFFTKKNRDLIDTAIVFMLDLSVSMSTIEVATVAAILTESMMGVPKLKVAILGFTTVHSYPYTHVPGMGRVDPLYIPIFKDFDELGWKPRARIGAIECSGLTPIGDAMMMGYDKLSSRKETRKVLVILSDGQSSYSVEDTRHNDDLLKRLAQSRCKRDSISLVGLELGSSAIGSLKPYVDSSIYLENFDGLAPAVISVIKNLAT